MNRKVRVALSTFIILSIAGLAFLVFFQYRTKGTLEVKLKGDQKVQVRIDRIRYSGTREGKVEWELEADSASRSRDEDLTVFQNIKATFYSKDGTPYTLTAKRGTLKELSGEISVDGSVVVETVKERYRLTAERLDYSTKSKEISSAGGVKITSDTLDVEGTGLTVNIDQGRFRLRGMVKAVFKGRPA